MPHDESVREGLRSAPRRWLVTGAAGFIGSHLVEALLTLGQQVTGLDNFSTGKRENLGDVLERVGRDGAARFRLLEGDVRDATTCREAATGVDFVLHEAAIGSVPRSISDPLTSHTNNVDGFFTLLLAAREAGVRRVVYASSSSVYGDSARSPKHEDELGSPLSPYAATKRIDELYADTLARTHGIDSVGLRYFNVFGPRQDPNGAYAAVIPRWTLALLSGDVCTLFGDGSTSRDFCYVENVVQANLLAACASETPLAHRVFNIGCGSSTTLLELFDCLAERAAAHRPEARAALLARRPFRPGDVPHSLASIERARAVLGYQPAYDVRRGLDKTVAWYATRAPAASEAAAGVRPPKERHELHANGRQRDHDLTGPR